MSRFTSEVGEAEGADPSKKFRISMNPWTNRPYSKRYYEILKTRESLPAWEAKR
jgi:pre-mRNA-splicing factor ATP-dependent RNA helicase DHX15/PRP43